MADLSIRALVDVDHEVLSEADELRAAVEGLCAPGVLGVATQPIIRLADLAVVGYEALARVPRRPYKGPDWWLDRAGELGMRARLEIACWRAIAACGPPPGGTLLFVNVSPAVLAEPDLVSLREQLPEQLVIEVTEQEAVADYMRLRADLEPWLQSRTRLAIDDTGSGHSTLRHVIELSPDFLKIDRSLVTSVDSDRNRRAVVRSLVAFAREVGSTVIAEGVETRAELDTLRDAEVDLVQGFLFGRPRKPWTFASIGRTVNAAEPTTRDWPRTGSVLRDADSERLIAGLAAARDAVQACERVVNHLYRRGDLMPSIYLERSGLLRCIARRGLWQVLDGMSAKAGITGRTWAGGEPIILEDVTTSSDYLEAIPGVVAEMCVPILFEGRAIGSLNVESLSPLPDGTLSLLNECARLLAGRLAVVGWRDPENPWQRAARASVAISGLALEEHAQESLIRALTDAAAMDSGLLIEGSAQNCRLTAAIGPLAEVLREVPVSELEQLSTLVDDVSSCYTGNEATGRGFVGTAAVRAHARAVIVLPLWAGGERLGTVVLCSSAPRHLRGRDVEPLELLAGHLAATLSATSLIGQLRQRAREDRLTGLLNRAAFEEFLASRKRKAEKDRVAVILDIDHFKMVNDRLGHLVGDELLSRMSAHLMGELRQGELFRYGGDEFALLLEGDDADYATEITESLVERARRVLSPYGSSISAGLARSRNGEAPRDVFRRADVALLWAKGHARGTAVLWAEEMGTGSAPKPAT